VEEFISSALQVRAGNESQSKDSAGKCLIHCQMGQNRSAALALGYMIRCLNLDLLTVLDDALEKRPVIMTNSSFLEQLIDLHLALQSINSLTSSFKNNI